MSNQICLSCECILREDDEVIAVVIARYHELGSKKIYCITRPTECLEIRHKNCNYPKGETQHE